MKLTRNYKYKIALILSAFLFGTTFLVVKNLLTTMTSSNIVFWRYVLASILFLIAGGIPDKETSKDALPLGIFLWLGYILQTEGLVTTSTINSGVITAFYIVLTPLFARFFLNKKLTPKTALRCSIGFTGIVLISYTAGAIVIGNVMTIACAASYALHIVFVQKNLKNHNIFQLMFIQSLIGSILCIPFISHSSFFPPLPAIKYLVFLGCAVNFGAFFLQLLGQRKVEASNAALLLSLEGVFATLLGIFFVGENLSFINWIGVFLVFVSIYLVISEK